MSSSAAAAQRVVGDVEHVVGLVVRAVELEQFDRGVDLAGQADRLDQAGDHPHATMGYPPVPLGPLVADRGSPQERAGQVGGHCGLQAPLDRQLFALEPALQLSPRVAHLHAPSDQQCYVTIAKISYGYMDVTIRINPTPKGGRLWRPRPN